MDVFDPGRMMISAHELGHAVVWRDEKLPPATVIEVRGTGRTANGRVMLAGTGTVNERYVRSILIGLLAGVAAGNRWREIHAPRLPADESAVDRCQLRRWSSLPEARQLRVAELRAVAQQAVRHRWLEIARLTPVLAERGHITL